MIYYYNKYLFIKFNISIINLYKKNKLPTNNYENFFIKKIFN